MSASIGHHVPDVTMRLSTSHMQMEDASEPAPPELRLALSVVCAAIHDVRTGARGKRTYEAETCHVYQHILAQDAKDFLLHRLNEADNYWGQLLREYGMRPLTPDRLDHLVRHRPLKSNEFNEAWRSLS